MPDPTNPPERERSWQAGPVRVRVTLPRREQPPPKERLTTERIVDTAMALMATEGYDAVSMRSLGEAPSTPERHRSTSTSRTGTSSTSS